LKISAVKSTPYIFIAAFGGSLHTALITRQRQPTKGNERSMSKVNIQQEIVFKTARSGGKGGQNVNKVETMVEGYFDVSASLILTGDQKQLVFQKLSNRINAQGILLIKSQSERTQLGNKKMVIRKTNDLINQSLVRPRKRIASAPTKASKEKRIDQKKQKSQVKEARKKVRMNES
jgi:ribosome-associated protein